MTNQPNTLVITAWLFPIVKPKLLELHANLKAASDNTTADTQASVLSDMVEQYHDLYGTFKVANLADFASLTQVIEAILTAVAADKLPALYLQKSLNASEVLLHELTNYVQTGVYRKPLILKRHHSLYQALAHYQCLDILHAGAKVAGDQATFIQRTTLTDTPPSADDASTENASVGLARINKYIEVPQIEIPESASALPLASNQRQTLAKAWRYGIQSLLLANTNEADSLQQLQRVAGFMLRDAAAHQATMPMQLWYLTAHWLGSLILNDTPTPKSYIQVLSNLDAIIVQPIDVAAASTSTMTDETLVAVYIQLAALNQTSDEAAAVLLQIEQGVEKDSAFFPRILAQLEQLIFQLHDPQAVIGPFKDIKSQLLHRGWTRFEEQINQILSDLQMSTESEELHGQLQWQVERQMQDLYGILFAAYQTIETQIGDEQTTFHLPPSVDAATGTDTAPVLETANADDASTHKDLTTISQQVMRQARIAVEDIKGAFKAFLQQHDGSVLQKQAEFKHLNTAFNDMGLTEVVAVIERLETLFNRIATQQLTHITWELTDTIADMLVTLELFMDYLAQQTLNNPLLARIEEQLLTAEHYLNMLIEQPDLLQSSLADLEDWPAKRDENTTRYDDSGQIGEDVQEAVALEGEQAAIQPAVAEESEELLAARAELKDDNFDMDEDIREIFIEEAEEVLETLDTYLPQWQADPQNLEPLGEIRRGFHTLKGSGRMVGAFNAGELAWAVENLLNRVLDKTLSVTDELITFITETKDLIPVLVEDFSNQRVPSIDPAITVLKAHNLQKGRSLEFGLQQGDASAPALAAATLEPLQFLTADDADDLAVMPTELPQQGIPDVLQPFMAEVTIPADADDADEDIKEIFIEEAEEVLEAIAPQYEHWNSAPDDMAALTEIRRGFHTLKGSGRMVGAHSSAEVAWAIEAMLNRVLENSIDVTPGIQLLVGDVIRAYPAMVNIYAQGATNYPGTMPLWIAAANAYSKKQGEYFDYKALVTPAVRKTATDTMQHGSFKETASDAEDSMESERGGIAAENLASATDHEADNQVFSHISNDSSIRATLVEITTANTKLENAVPINAPINAETTDFEQIFLDEAAELIGAIEGFIANNHDKDTIAIDDDIVRAFHTLRGAAGSPSLKAISDMSATVEHSLEQLQQHDEPMTAGHLQAVGESVVLIKKYINDFKASSAANKSASNNSDANNVLAPVEVNQQDVKALQGLFDSWVTEEDGQEMSFNVSDIIDDDIDDLLDGEWTVENHLTQTDTAAVELYAEVLAVQCRLLLARVTGSKKFTLVVSSLEAVYRRIIAETSLAQSDEVVDALLAGHQQLTNLLDAMAGSMTLKVDAAAIAKLHAIAKPPNLETLPAEAAAAPQVMLDIEDIDTDPELLEIFLEEAQEIDAEVSASFQQWRQSPEDFEALKVLQRHLHTIKGGARMSGIRSIGDLTHEAETIYEYFVEGRIKPSMQWVAVMQGVQDTLSGQIEYVVRSGQSFFANKLVEQLHTLSSNKEVPDDYRLELPVLSTLQNDNSEDADPAAITDADTDATKTPADEGLAEAQVAFKRLQTNSWDGELPDSDILEVFLEEAQELVESSGVHMQTFHANTGNVAVLRELQRELHTLKGGARMIDADGIANLGHEMENVYEDLASRRRPATRMISQLLTLCHEWIGQGVYLLKNGINPPMPTPLITELQNFSRSPDALHALPKVSLQDYIDAIADYDQWRDTNTSRRDISQIPLATGSFTQASQLATQSNEMIRVSSGLMEQMINLSGEAAINRARIDMSMTSIHTTIDEMETTVQRLSDQLRRMDIELEAQILSTIDDADLLDEGFDPLEMDQYSALNQLSKSLSESASDLLDIKSTIVDKTRDAEDLLLQLSRTQAELQNGLMNSRMVPFSRLTPRLQRIVRQTANELDKLVELEVTNADDEMDRTILDRITSPLEHMLRNAVDHGVEQPDEREANGKPRTGRIVLDVAREGGEVVIKLSDDGKGIDVEAVRKKAISQGLIDKDDTSITDLDVMQYIFNAGLTTTNKVTQISGRGVGMDVVLSEIRQLGGTVSVESEAGKGSTFAIRVPLTVAISDALVVRVADAYYAIPLIQIERVERVNPEALFEYYQSDSNTFAINGTDYRLRYLNEMLTGVSLNELAVSTNVSLPVIIVKNQTGQNLAIQVDEVAGARIEVVVKPLGRQLSHIAGLSAATIMGDGSVLLILDILALIRNAPARSILKKQIQKELAPQKARHQILVVDDSVTVRKVTSRLLERQGYDVQVARDGIEALEVLQDVIPDLMLLDIEMPRMDGFEVATHIRHDSRLKDLPIIMITSRTGDKHRERAMSIGVNQYLGKPFQEGELVNIIQSIIGVTTGVQ